MEKCKPVPQTHLRLWIFSLFALLSVILFVPSRAEACTWSNCGCAARGYAEIKKGAGCSNMQSPYPDNGCWRDNATLTACAGHSWVRTGHTNQTCERPGYWIEKCSKDITLTANWKATIKITSIACSLRASDGGGGVDVILTAHGAPGLSAVAAMDDPSSPRGFGFEKTGTFNSSGVCTFRWVNVSYKRLRTFIAMSGDEQDMVSATLGSGKTITFQ